MNYTCKECGFNLWMYIDGHEGKNGLAVSHLGLYNDGRFPGRCLLVLDEHHTDFGRLDLSLMEAFMQDVQVAGRAIEQAVGADRINYAILGNAVPHIHCHILPRFFDNDPNPKSTPWSRKDKAWKMSKNKYEKIMLDIKALL